MHELMIEYMEKALEFEESGFIESAVVLYNKLLDLFPEETATILTEKAKMEFRNMLDKEALMDFIHAYTIEQDEELYHLILEAYLNPNKEMLQTKYQVNMALIQRYPFYWNDYNKDELDAYVLWSDESVICMVNLAEKAFGILQRRERMEQHQEEASFMMTDQLWESDILYYKEQMKLSRPLMDLELPYYLVYNKFFWQIFTQIAEIPELLLENRAVFLIGEQSLQNYFEDLYALPPQKIWSFGIDATYKNLSLKIFEQKAQLLEQCESEYRQYYKTHDQEILHNIQEGKPRILFITSHFTTVLQYHTRDCQRAAERFGCKTQLLIEPDGLHRMMNLVCAKYLWDFKPDIVFCIDHFRFEHGFSEKLVWITWVQDPMPHIMNRETPLKLNHRDFVMNHFTTWNDFKAIGYPQKFLIDAPIPANEQIYKTYVLSRAELEAYSCDICFVCHGSDVEKHIAKTITYFPEELREMIQAVYYGYQSFVTQTGQLIYQESEFTGFIRRAMLQHFNYACEDSILELLATDMYLYFNQRVYRQALVDWIIEAGFTNLKLWGQGWQESTKYKKYAMGVAPNGETLSKIYQASKIVVGNNIATTAAARAWESMLSGAFYMSNYIPPESDITDIRKIVDVGQDLVMFYDKEDLIQKLHYYLEHEEARQEMIERGKKAALEKMTFEKLMKRVIDEVGARLKEDEYA